jgi:hypothetical protein
MALSRSSARSQTPLDDAGTVLRVSFNHFPPYGLTRSVLSGNLSAFHSFARRPFRWTPVWYSLSSATKSLPNFPASAGDGLISSVHHHCCSINISGAARPKRLS